MQNLRALSNKSLVHGLKQALTTERRALAEFLRHLLEYDGRRLYELDGHSSLFKYLVEGLNLSEASAAKRLAVMRLLGRWPDIFEIVASGDLHLTGLYALSKYLTDANYETILEKCRSKSKTWIDGFLGSEFGANCLTKSQRDLVRPIVAAMAVPLSIRSAVLDQSVTQPMPSQNFLAPNVSAPAHHRPEITPEVKPESTPALLSVPGEKSVRLSTDLSSEAYADLKRARDLLGVRDFGAVIGQALKTFLKKKDPLNRKDRMTNPQSEPQNSAECRMTGTKKPGKLMPIDSKPEVPISAGQTKEVVAETLPPHRGRYIPQAERSKVSRRDELRCTYVSANGHRCGEMSGLQLDHRLPFAKGGAHTADNLRLMCGPHNRLLARQVYGADFIAEKIQRARLGRAVAKVSPKKVTSEPESQSR